MVTVAVFLALLFLGMPIFAAILMAAIVFLIVNDLSVLFDGLPLQFYSSLEVNGLLAIPLFVLVGEIMNKGGLTQRLIAVTNLFVGRFKGGLAYANLITNAMAASILGSAIAQIGVMSKVMIPAMEKQGYDKALSGAITASGGLLGPIFPPSMLMIIYGVVAVQPIAPLFIAGIIPALLIVFGFCLVVFLMGCFSQKIPAVQTVKDTGEQTPTAKVLIDGILPGFIPLVVIVGIASGVMTPTEAGAVASLIAFILCLIYREIKVSDLSDIFVSVATLTATICGLIASATLLSWVLSFEGVPDRLVEAIATLTDSPFWFMLLVFAVLLFLGMFLESISAMIVLVPILMPVVVELGIDPIQFGVLCAIATTLGVLTPPVGPGLFIVMSQTGVAMKPLMKMMIPFLLVILVVVIAIIALPELSVWLPSVFVK
ncbi:MAG: TRAP transporter large permease [Pelistega sp.]|nr:TRAP transporter large permease [Pelistega sp.]